LKIRFIPIAQVALVAMAMLAIQWLSPRMNIQGAANVPLFVIFSASGVALVLIGVREFFRNNTTVSPVNPENTTHLVTSGIYSYSRNPMYVGFALCLLAWAALIGSYISLVGLPVFIWYLTKHQIIPEEFALESKFGKSFIEYKNRVRRWI